MVDQHDSVTISRTPEGEDAVVRHPCGHTVRYGIARPYPGASLAISSPTMDDLHQWATEPCTACAGAQHEGGGGE